MNGDTLKKYIYATLKDTFKQIDEFIYYFPIDKHYSINYHQTYIYVILKDTLKQIDEFKYYCPIDKQYS